MAARRAELQEVLTKLKTNRGLWLRSLAGLAFMTVSLLFPRAPVLANP